MGAREFSTTLLKRGLFRRRHIHTALPSAERVRHDLRAVLRETAQPVAVITSLMPRPSSSSSSSSIASEKDRLPRFHGATLSSFSSIAMDPHPLVAFSLRIPSRMATALKDAHLQSTEADPVSDVNLPTHMVVNILSTEQADVAVQFSRTDIYPRPFDYVQYRLTEEGLPVLEGSLGALSCKLVAASWPLHDLDLLKHGHSREGGRDAMWKGDGVASELFIAQVLRVEALESRVEGETAKQERTPLLYYRRSYATTRDVPPISVASNAKSP